jgi:tRNA threonylcarbamoyladenosine modification (KEOPS) complex  Pcc1 subunit
MYFPLTDDRSACTKEQHGGSLRIEISADDVGAPRGASVSSGGPKTISGVPPA